MLKESDIIWEWDIGKFGYYAILEKSKYYLYKNGLTHASRISSCSYSDKDKAYEYFNNEVNRRNRL